MWGFVILARLVDFQVFRHQILSALAAGVYRIDKPITPARGVIYDSQMAELATSVRGSTVVVSLMAVGILLNIASQRKTQEDSQPFSR